jgi:CheY-like chemotaxis protein
MAARVLVIDDSRFLRTALEKILTAKGFEVRAAADGEEGLRLAQEEKFHLILLDVFLPKMTGHEVLKRLKNHPATDTIPVLLLSGVAKPTKLEERKSAGTAEFQTKQTLDLAAIVASAESCLGEEAAHF